MGVLTTWPSIQTRADNRGKQMPKNTKMCKEKIINIRESVANDGFSIKDIAAIHGVNYYSVYQAIRGWTYKNIEGPVVDRKRFKMTNEAHTAINLYKTKGYSIALIAHMIGCGKTTVKKVFAGGYKCKA